MPTPPATTKAPEVVPVESCSESISNAVPVVVEIVRSLAISTGVSISTEPEPSTKRLPSVVSIFVRSRVVVPLTSKLSPIFKSSTIPTPP